MDDRIDALALILDAEEELYRRLRDLLHEEREILPRLDAQLLTAIARSKEELCDEGRLLEQSRLAACTEIARALGIDEARPRLSRLCGTLGDRGAVLRASHNRLVVMIGVVRELLEENAALARSSLAQVRGTIHLLGGLVPREACYASTAAVGNVATPAAPGQLVRQSA